MSLNVVDASKGGNSEIMPNALISIENFYCGLSVNPSVTSAVSERSAQELSDAFGVSLQLSGFGEQCHD